MKKNQFLPRIGVKNYFFSFIDIMDLYDSIIFFYGYFITIFFLKEKKS
jgi:hypothetical protein